MRVDRDHGLPYTRFGSGRMVSQTPDPAGGSIVDGYGVAESYGYDGSSHLVGLRC